MARGKDAARRPSKWWLGRHFAERASLDLQRTFPHLSAMRACLPGQARRLRQIMAVTGVIGLTAPLLFLVGTTGLLFAGFAMLTLWRIVILSLSFFVSPARTQSVDPRGYLPIYTVMVALYDEAAAVPGLAEALRKLDWPETRLDVLILMEEGDLETRKAAKAAHWPLGTRLLVLPPGRPQTKPRALNFGLLQARGRYVCIYDAEDRPDPAQLKAAFAAFQNSADPIACVQAPLVAFNRRESWLSAHWNLEYAIQFSRLLPTQARLGLPILLGGTSNHFETKILRGLGAWDPWNVTEDADLGVRIARLGYGTATIDVPTLEEAPESLSIWTSQRSRWLKGFIVTWLVLMRHPRESAARLGLGGMLAVHAGLIGTVMTSLAHAPLLLWCVASLALGQAGWVCAGLVVLFAGYGATFLAGLTVPKWAGRPGLFTLLTLPLYWPLHTFAAIRAIYGLFHAPSFWAKTPHGLTRAVPG